MNSTVRTDTLADGEPLRVLMFGWEFPPFQSGGLATATLGLVKGLLQQGARVTLVVPFPVEGATTPSNLKLLSTARRFQRLKHIRIASPLSAYGGQRAYVETLKSHVTGTRGGPVYGTNLFDEVRRFAAVAADIAAEEPHDIIDAHDWITFGAGLAARRVSGRPFVAHIHATEFDRSAEGEDVRISQRERDGMLAADVVISNSQALKDQVTTRYGIPASKIAVVHWGIDRDTPTWEGQRPNPLPEGVPVVLFLGRVTRQKGPDHFVEVARKVLEFEPTVHFVVAGTGDMLPHVITRAVDLGMGERMHFAGPVSGSEVDRAFKLASVCVMPSVSEPFGLVALESMRSGTPCIVPKRSGAAEVLQNVFKVDFWDLDEMTNKIVALLRFPELHAELKQQGTNELRASRFSLDEPARHTLDVYERVLSKDKALIA